MKEKIKLGYIGLGGRGMGMLLSCFNEMDDIDIVYLCDLRNEVMEEAAEAICKKGKNRPVLTADYHTILEDPSVDAVVIMTGWDCHVSCAIDSVLAGKYTAMEVGCAYDISECYELINAYEKTKAPLMMLENCCYGRREMAALKMVKEGLFGEIAYCGGAYHHYLPGCDMFVAREDGTYNTYRALEYLYRNCEQYPTHELGPISKILNINRGNRMMTLSSFASKAVGINEYIRGHLPEEKERFIANYRQGDIISTNITCAGGELIHLTLDTTLPRPYYSREFTVRGTKGCYIENCENNATVFFDGMEELKKDGNEEEMLEKYDHPLHREYREGEQKGGHGGIDWLVVRAFVESVKRGIQTPIDAYDTVSWLSIAPLSEMSIARGGAPVDIPDFTRGKWFRREPALETKYSLDLVCVDKDTKI